MEHNAENGNDQEVTIQREYPARAIAVKEKKESF
jgi:hypothetical protein